MWHNQSKNRHRYVQRSDADKYPTDVLGANRRCVPLRVLPVGASGSGCCLSVLFRESRSILEKQNADELPLRHVHVAAEPQEHWGPGQASVQLKIPRQQHSIGRSRNRCSEVPSPWNPVTAQGNRQGIGIWTDITTAVRHSRVARPSDCGARINMGLLAHSQMFVAALCRLLTPEKHWRQFFALS